MEIIYVAVRLDWVDIIAKLDATSGPLARSHVAMEFVRRIIRATAMKAGLAATATSVRILATRLTRHKGFNFIPTGDKHKKNKPKL